MIVFIDTKLGFSGSTITSKKCPKVTNFNRKNRKTSTKTNSGYAIQWKSPWSTSYTDSDLRLGSCVVDQVLYYSKGVLVRWDTPNKPTPIYRLSLPFLVTNGVYTITRLVFFFLQDEIPPGRSRPTRDTHGPFTVGKHLLLYKRVGVLECPWNLSTNERLVLLTKRRWTGWRDTGRCPLPSRRESSTPTTGVSCSCWLKLSVPLEVLSFQSL